MAVSLPLTRTQVSSPAQVASRTTPLAKSMALSIHNNHAQTQHYGGTSHLLMRILSAEGSTWGGVTHIDKAQVDAWMDFIWSAIDIPVALLLVGTGSDESSIQMELNAALAIVDRHLLHRTFLVGGPTICDIALTAALHAAGAFWKPPSNTNLSRFYETMIHQDFWIQALEVHASDPEHTV